MYHIYFNSKSKSYLVFDLDKKQYSVSKQVEAEKYVNSKFIKLEDSIKLMESFLRV